jgi:hypothetical protein
MLAREAHDPLADADISVLSTYFYDWQATAALSPKGPRCRSGA